MTEKRPVVAREKPHAFKAAKITWKGERLGLGIGGPAVDPSPPCRHCGGSEFSSIHGWGKR